jgi:hypothetical protein
MPLSLKTDFISCQNGLISLTLPTSPSLALPQLPASLITSKETTLVVPQKRKLSAMDLEIPDSDAEDDEDYGWAEEDEEDVPPPPPQWQGSEDNIGPVDAELEPEDVDPELNFRDEVEGEAQGQETPMNLRTEIEDSEDELAL